MKKFLKLFLNHIILPLVIFYCLFVLAGFVGELVKYHNCKTSTEIPCGTCSVDLNLLFYKKTLVEFDPSAELNLLPGLGAPYMNCGWGTSTLYDSLLSVLVFLVYSFITAVLVHVIKLYNKYFKYPDLPLSLAKHILFILAKFLWVVILFVSAIIILFFINTKL